MDISDVAITIIHLVIGFILVFYAAKAYKKTRYPPMLLLVAGFTVLVLGETVVEDALYFIGSKFIQETIAEAFEIVGFIILILAVKKS
jgi:uncharacterized membrane protein YccC